MENVRHLTMCFLTLTVITENSEKFNNRELVVTGHQGQAEGSQDQVRIIDQNRSRVKANERQKSGK